MTIESVELLYDRLYDTINELVDVGEDPDRLYDCVIDHFAFMAEDAARREKAYSSLLNKFRDNDPILTVPEAEKKSEAIDWDVDEVGLDPTKGVDFFDGMSDINKSLMSEDADRFLDFVKNIKFSDKLDS